MDQRNSPYQYDPNFADAVNITSVRMGMLIINLLLLVVGCVMDMGSAILFFTPILPPIA